MIHLQRQYGINIIAVYGFPLVENHTQITKEGQSDGNKYWGRNCIYYNYQYK